MKAALFPNAGRARWLAAAAVTVAAPVAAQVPPAAQVLRQNPTVNPDRINEEQRQRLQERVSPDTPPPRSPQVEAPPPAAATAGDQPEVRFTLTAVRFDPSSYLSAAELDALARPLIGTEVTLGDLQRIVDRINALYAERNLTTARAALPAQPIDGGVVRIALVEGRIGATTAEGGSARGRAFAQRYGAPATGELAAPAALEERLRLFNLNNDAQLRARLVPGTGYGTTDVTLVVAEPARVSADVFTDNNGFASTGRAEVGAVVRAYRLFGGADRASAVVVASRGVISTSASFSAPLTDRVRVQASGSYGRTEVKYGPLAALDVRGTSYSFGGDLAALLVVGDRVTLTGTAGAQTSLSTTAIGGSDVIRNAASTASLGLNGSYAVPGFTISGQIETEFAHVRERLSSTETDALLIQGSLFAAKAIGARVQARLRADWQLSVGENLPGVLQYQIGGSRTGRAFDPGIAAGDRGFSTAAELAYGALWDGLALEPYVFVEHAQINLPDRVTAGQSLGAGLTLNYSPRLSVRGSVATDIGRSADLTGSTRAFVSTTVHF